MALDGTLPPLEQAWLTAAYRQSLVDETVFSIRTLPLHSEDRARIFLSMIKPLAPNATRQMNLDA